MTDDNGSFSRSGNSDSSGKCTAEVKTHVPEEMKEALSALAALNGQTLSEYVREVLKVHVYGYLATVRPPLNHQGR